MPKRKDRLFLGNMVLKPNGDGGGTFWFAGVTVGFGLIFAGVILLIVAVFAAMAGFGTQSGLMRLFANREFRFAVGFTLQTSFWATAGATVTGIPCGYVLARQEFRGKVLADLLLDLPVVLPPLISGVALLILFGPVLGAGLSQLGLNVVFSPLGVVVAQWFVALPLAIKMFREAFAAVDPRYEKVGRTLGGSADRVFWRVTLPMARRGIGAGIAMAWARTLGEFGATAMLAGVTRMKTETLAAAVFLNMSMGQLETAVGIAVLMFGAAVLVLLVFKVLLGEGRGS
jgi:molybdate transport system permease protein